MLHGHPSLLVDELYKAQLSGCIERHGITVSTSIIATVVSLVINPHGMDSSIGGCPYCACMDYTAWSEAQCGRLVIAAWQ